MEDTLDEVLESEAMYNRIKTTRGNSTSSAITNQTGLQTPLLADSQESMTAMREGMSTVGTVVGSRTRVDSVAFFPVAEDYEHLKGEDEEFDLKVCKAYVLDAVKGRMPNLRIQMRDEINICGVSMTPLRAYNLVHHRIWRRMLTFAIFFHLALAVWEYNHPIVCTCLELLILGLYLADAMLRTFSHDRDQDIGETWFPLTWARARYVAIGLALADLFVFGLCFTSLRNSAFRLSRLLRPYFLIERGRVLRQLMTAVMYTIPKVMEVVVLIGFNIVIFGIFGFYLFSERGLRLGNNPNFVNLETSCWSLVVLMSTANFPDVMMASYSYSNWTAIFFVLYLLTALYLLFQIILAAVFSRFQDKAKEILSQIPKIQTVCLCAVYELLADTTITESSVEQESLGTQPADELQGSPAVPRGAAFKGFARDDYNDDTSQPSEGSSSRYDASMHQSDHTRVSIPMTDKNPQKMIRDHSSNRLKSFQVTSSDAVQKKRMWEQLAGVGAQLEIQELQKAGVTPDTHAAAPAPMAPLHPAWTGGITAEVARKSLLRPIISSPGLGPTTGGRSRGGSVDCEDEYKARHETRVGSVPVLPTSALRGVAPEKKSLGDTAKKPQGNRSVSFATNDGIPKVLLEEHGQFEHPSLSEAAKKTESAAVEDSSTTLASDTTVPASLLAEEQETASDNQGHRPSGLTLSLATKTSRSVSQVSQPEQQQPRATFTFASLIRQGNLPEPVSPRHPSFSARPQSPSLPQSPLPSQSNLQPQAQREHQPTQFSSPSQSPTPDDPHSADSGPGVFGSLTTNVVSRSAFHRFVSYVRHDLEPDHINIIFNAMDTSKTGYIDLREWLRLIDFIDVSFKLQDDPEAYRAPESAWEKAKSFLKSSMYNTLCDLLVIFNAILVAIMLSVERDSTSYRSLAGISLVLTVLFALELTIRVIVIGPKQFFRSTLNVFDVLIVSAAIVLRATSAAGLTNRLLREIDLFRVIRIVRVLSLSKRARAILNTVGRLTPALRSLFMILISIYYLFAIVGVGFFKDVIRKGHMSEEFMRTYYAQNNYWENNFNDIMHAFVLLFEIMIVNNWNLTVEAFVVATGTNWTRVYFVAYFFCTVVVGMNVVVALILEAFITKYSSAETELESEEDTGVDLDSEYRAALTAALNEYAESRDSGDLPGTASSVNDGSSETPGATSENDGARRDTTKLRRLWQVVLKRRTQRMYKLIFDSKNLSQHIRGE